MLDFVVVEFGLQPGADGFGDFVGCRALGNKLLDVAPSQLAFLLRRDDGPGMQPGFEVLQAEFPGDGFADGFGVFPAQTLRGGDGTDDDGLHLRRNQAQDGQEGRGLGIFPGEIMCLINSSVTGSISVSFTARKVSTNRSVRARPPALPMLLMTA